MTESLSRALRARADVASCDAPDLAAIRAAGTRSLRRRRVATTLGGLGGVVAASVLVVASLSWLPGGDDTGRDVPIATDPGGTGASEVIWVEGSVLRRAVSGDLDLGRPAVALGRTAAGTVFADASGRVYSQVGTEITPVGRTGTPDLRLASDAAGRWAAWLDPRGTRLVVLDQDDNTTEELALDGDDTVQVHLTALDGRTAYVSVGDEARSIDVVDGESRVVADDGTDVIDAVGSRLALGDDSGIRTGAPGPGAGPATVLRSDYADIGAFSPDGAYFTSDADEPRVVSTEDGEAVTLDLPEGFATAFEWLDDGTVVVISAASETAPLTLSTCRVPDGACSTVVDLDSYEVLVERGFALPVGLELSP